MKLNKKVMIFICLISISLVILGGCGMKYRVFFNEYDGTQTYQDITEGETASNYTPIKEGYEFLGWYTEDDELFDFSTPITKNINLYAYYGRKEWTVTFKVSDTDSSKNFTKTVTHDYLCDKPSDPELDEYLFLGWYNGENLFDFTTTYITSDITLTAKFVKDSEYKPLLIVKLDSNLGGTFADLNVNRLSTIANLPTPSKEGYTFIGWYLGSELITTETIITEINDFTLLAHYQKNE